MNITIDGMQIPANPGQSVLELIRQQGLDRNKLSERPLCAKISGEVFTLNYIPVRTTDKSCSAGYIRRAMSESGGEIKLLKYSDQTGREAYYRSMLYILFLAVRQLYPTAVAKNSCALGSTVYIKVEGVNRVNIELLKKRMEQIVEQDIPLLRSRIPLSEAIEHFRKDNQPDKAELLSWRNVDYYDAYVHGDYVDYFYGEMVPSTGYLKVWDILDADGGFLLVYPDENNPDRLSKVISMPRFFSVFSEGEQWGELMECETVSNLNDLTRSGKIRELIRVNEALHEKRYSQVADMVCERGAKAVMLAGPSSSGKTTSANRLATQLRVHGKKPILMSLDDYYLNRDTIQPGPDGKLDLEHINTIDVTLFRKQMETLLNGESIEIPSFNFITGKREWTGKVLKLEDASVIIVEGLHGLNPVMIPDNVDSKLIFRLYVSPLIPLNLDNHNRIPTSYLRLLRRIVRDYETRGSSVQRTMSMWESVQRGERLWIYPFQENADVIFNSSTLYEIAVLKKHIFPLLTAVKPDDTYYEQVRSVVKILNYVMEADVDDEIPPTSLVREFIGGNSFYR